MSDNLVNHSSFAGNFLFQTKDVWHVPGIVIDDAAKQEYLPLSTLHLFIYMFNLLQIAIDFNDSIVLK